MLYFTFLLPERERNQKNVRDAYEANTLSIRVAHQWFDRFRSGVVVEKDVQNMEVIDISVSRVLIVPW